MLMKLSDESMSIKYVFDFFRAFSYGKMLQVRLISLISAGGVFIFSNNRSGDVKLDMGLMCFWLPD